MGNRARIVWRGPGGQAWEARDAEHARRLESRLRKRYPVDRFPDRRYIHYWSEDLQMFIVQVFWG